MIGDLIASVLKRLAGMKDSGGAIPGIGGLLDLTDSLILSAPTGYFIILVLISHESARNVVLLGCHWVDWRKHPAGYPQTPDRLNLIGISAHQQAEKLCQIAHEFGGQKCTPRS